MTKLFCDLKTDEEKSAFFLFGRGYETGVIAHSIQNDVAMAYHRCAEYRKEMDALQAENERLRKDAERYRYMKKGGGWIVAATQTGWHVDGEELDDLIDNEMEQKNGV